MKVAVSVDGLTPDDYARSGCDAALAACPRRWKSDYEMAVADRVRAADAAGDDRAVAASRVVLAVLAIREPWSTAPIPAVDNPYWPTYEFAESAYTYLALILGLAPTNVPTVKDTEVRARAADLLYQRSVGTGGKRDFRAAVLAVESYLEEATDCETRPGRWGNAEHRVGRAFEIAVELKNKPLKDKVVGHIAAVLVASASPIAAGGASTPTTTPSRYPLQLLRLLLRHFRKGNGDDPFAYATLAARLGQDALAVQDWRLARDYLAVASKWYAYAGDAVRELATAERAAESWIEQGTGMVARPDIHDIHYLLAEQKLREGIQALRATAGRAKEQGRGDDEARIVARIDEVRRLHRAYQKRGVRGMPTYRDSITIDSDPIFAVVEGREKFDALFAMANVALPSRAEVEAEVREERETYLSSRFFGLVQFEEDGRTAARSDAYGDGGTGDTDLWARMCQRAAQMYESRAQIHVEPHRWKVDQDHAVDVNDFAWIAHASPFVPEGREPLFARGLHAGMNGNFGMAVHLLIPQIEHALRDIVRSLPLATDGEREARQELLSDPDWPSLGQSLCGQLATDLADALGDEGQKVVFALRVILIERFGGNLRNRVFHGLTSYGGVMNWQCWYLWWLVLKICCSTARDAARQQRNGEGRRRGE